MSEQRPEQMSVEDRLALIEQSFSEVLAVLGRIERVLAWPSVVFDGLPDPAHGSHHGVSDPGSRHALSGGPFSGQRS